MLKWITKRHDPKAAAITKEICVLSAEPQTAKKETNHQNIYVIDRGLQSTRAMKAFSDDKIIFVCRAKENRKHIEIESYLSENQEIDLGESIVLKASFCNHI